MNGPVLPPKKGKLTHFLSLQNDCSTKFLSDESQPSDLFCFADPERLITNTELRLDVLTELVKKLEQELYELKQ